MSERKVDWVQGGVIFLLLVARACAFGWQYWPQLDDYIQYHNYAAGFTFAKLQETVGVLASRPLAGMADYFVWSPLFDRMILGVVAISALYAVSAVLMKGLLQRYFQVGPFFLVIMTLMPLGVEGTYWMSAASRVVVGLFCACLAARAFAWWLDRGRFLAAGVFLVLMLLPFGFYEQSAILAMTLVLGMAMLECRKSWKRSLLALWTLPATGIYFTVCGWLSNGGVYASRMELVLPTSAYYWNTFLPDVLGQLKTVFLAGNVYTLAKGFLRGARAVTSGELLLWSIILLILSILYALCCRNAHGTAEKRSVFLAFTAGFLLALAPVTIFFLLANPWFSFRGAVTSFAGIALFCDTLLMTIWRYLPVRRIGTAVLAGAMCVVFCMAGASEIGDYRATYDSDQQAASTVLERLEQDGLLNAGENVLRIGILGLEPSHLPDQNYYWHEHMSGCTESAWAFTGLLVSQMKEGTLPSVNPLPTWPIYKRWNAQANDPAGFDCLYWYSGEKIVPIMLEATGEKAWSVRLEDGSLLGRIWEEANGLGYFERT